ncbi:MAG TPA: hypothetical protein VG318_12065 [Actinomycetota bacterium]|nr:hypothetical protein [Actinomycetota bacterium]
MAGRTLDEFSPSADDAHVLDRAVSKSLISFANRRSRRSFLALVGRGSVALMGTGFLGLWRLESAEATSHCGGPHTKTDRVTCMCSEINGQNNCSAAACCGGYWLACPTNTANPATCYVNDPGGGVATFSVKLFDCCSQCSSQCDFSKAGCNSTYGDNFCCSEGYCFDNCGSPANGWRVKCIKKICQWDDPCP